MQGKVRVFAGLASAVAMSNASCHRVSDDHGRAGGRARTALATGPDAFADKNAMALVVQIDRSLIVVPGRSTVAVWVPPTRDREGTCAW